MHIKIHSDSGELSTLARRIVQEGNNVELVSRVDSITSSASTLPDIHVLDGLFGQESENLRRRGNKVLGSSLWSDTIESNPEYTRTLLDTIGWSQSKLTRGTNLYVTAFFNGNTFISVYTSFIYRRFMRGGNGPDLGGVGVLSNFSQPTEVIYNKILRPLETTLRKVNHQGVIHLHLLVSNDTFEVREMSTKFAHPLTYIQFENGKCRPSNVLLKLLDPGSQPIRPKDKWAGSVLISILPYPNQSSGISIPLHTIQPEAVKHLWLIDVKEEDGKYSSAGTSGKLGWVSAYGNFPEEAMRRVYRTISFLSIPGLQYRTDIGQGLEPYITNLTDYGWIK